MPGKMVDFAVVDGKSTYTTHLRGEIAEINHTTHPPIRDKAILTSIETKREAQGRDKALEQLKIWVSSHFKSLESLFGEPAVLELDYLPLIQVLGCQ